ncbi:MAG: hypothetical protein ABEJ40_06070 [Haloarculaceae archaeon]
MVRRSTWMLVVGVLVGVAIGRVLSRYLLRHRAVPWWALLVPASLLVVVAVAYERT